MVVVQRQVPHMPNIAGIFKRIESSHQAGIGIVFETSGVVLLQKDWRFWCKGWIGLMV